MRKNANRLYKDLAWLWPIWEDVEVYREESELFARLIKKHAKMEVRTLLDMGCGGGKNTFHLKRHFEVTGVDLSKPMIANARKLNPECRFRFADMRDFDLKSEFDSVLINDATAYMTTRRDLLKGFKAAHRHLKAGGVMITHPEECRESFKQNENTIWKAKTDDVPAEFNFEKPVEQDGLKPRLIVPGPTEEPVSVRGRILERDRFEEMREKYYTLRGWDPETGLQTAETLQQLKLSDLIPELEKGGLVA